MGNQLSVEEASSLCVNELGVEETHVHCWLSNGIVKTTCLVEETWLQDVHAGSYTRPQWFPGSNYERFLLLQPSNQEIPKSWTRVSVKVFQKPLKKSRVPRDIKENEFLESDSFAELMSYISTENFKNYLLQASKKYSSDSSLFDEDKPDLVSGEEVITNSTKIFGLKIIKLNDVFEQQPTSVSDSCTKNKLRFEDELTVTLSERNVPCFVPVFGVIESTNAFFVVEPFIQHSLQDVVWFSPSVVTSTIAKPLFLLFQILHLFETFHQLHYYCSVNTIQDILVSKCLWLSLSTNKINLGETKVPHDGTRAGSTSTIVDGTIENSPSQDALTFANVGSMSIPIPVQTAGLSQLVDMWVKKEISNFDYLMALNTIAGRRFGDPNYHPVLPWVTDFSRPTGNYRDLTKSKFRINKGDNQLDLTYKGMSDADGDLTENPPHHVSGVLSEITYHMYLARRTPKSVLQKHVRAKWEPNEYPSSMQRLQEWTPDECIPEFYADSTIFKSIHSDLPDLEVPKWAKSYEDFINLHRAALESEYVCSHVHHWIDLTFGCKLVGVAAEKAKNVYLHLVDQHQTVTNHGVLPLFLEPHPAQQHHHHEMVLYPSTLNFEDGLDHELRNKTRTIEGLPKLTGEDLPSSSWDNVDMDVKIEAAEDELATSVSSFKRLKLARPNLPAFLRLKDSVETSTDAGPSIDSMPISLPIGYDPLEMFHQVQLRTKFKLQSKQNDLTPAKTYPQSNQVKLFPKSDIPDTPRHQEIQNLCSILMEIFLPSKMRLLSNNLSRREKFIAAIRVFRAGKFALPGIFRDGMKTLFDEGLGFHKRHGLAPLTPELLTQTHVSVFPFPSYFKRLYEFLVEFYSEPPLNKEQTTSEEKPDKLRTWTTNGTSCTLYQVDVTVKHLAGLLEELNEEGLDLLMTFLIPLFSCKETQLQAFLHLFEPLATNLGHKKARKVFLKLVLKQYDVRTSSSSLALFHQSFLSKLIMLFGMEEFLNHFVTFIVDVLWSKEDSEISIETYSQDEVQGVIIEDYKDTESRNLTENCCDNGTLLESTEGQSVSDVHSLVTSDETLVAQETGTVLEPGCGTPLGGRTSAGLEKEFSTDESALGENEIEDDVETKERNPDILKQSLTEDWYHDSPVDTDFSLERSISFRSDNTDNIENEEESIIDSVDSEIDISEAAAESLCWLSPRLGPVLASNYITKPLLTMLVKCFVGVVGMGDRGIIIGNGNAKWILHCLGRFAEIYGEAVILHQYLPFITSKINIVSEQVSVKGEANLAAALVLVRHCVCYLSEKSLLEQFQELCHQMLHQVLCLLSSGTITFASGASARVFLALLTIEILKIVCDTLERQSAQELLHSLIRTFFSSFDKAYRVLDPSLPESPSHELQPRAREIQETFTASLAHHAYITLCQCLGGTYMETTLCNHDLIWQLCCSIDEALSNNTPSITYQPVVVLSDDEANTSTKKTDSIEPGKPRSCSIYEGSSSQSFESARKENSLERNMSLGVKDSKSSSVITRRHLIGNWLKYWKNNLGKRNRVDGHSFCNLKLQTFTGHSDVIRDIWVQDSEHLFLSASRDKTVKLWSLSNHGSGSGQSACSWTTYDHRKPVFAVDVVDVTRQAVSCDGSVHIWDLPTGSSVLKLNCPKNNQAVAMTTLPSPSPCVVAAMQNLSVRFIDTREGNFGQTWKVTSNNVSGPIRSICVNKEGTSMAVGFSSGWLSIIDLRGGILSRQWKAHETDVVQIKSYSATSFVTLSSGQKMYLWANDGVTLASLVVPNGYGEFVNKICVYDKVIISSIGHNRLGWHTFNDKEPSYHNVRFGTDSFKGNFTCFGVLPLNHAYLCGSDNGNITLMA